MPLVPLESEFALLSVTKPVEEDALAPLVITTSPPVWYAAVARPADSTRAAPAPLDPGPTTTLMLPAWPLVEAPVLNSNDPELPDELLPVANTTWPDTADGDEPTDTLPDAELTLWPLSIYTAPPVVLASPWPAIRLTDPGTLPVEVPADRIIEPADPESADPTSKLMEPLFPEVDAPVLRRIDPVLPETDAPVAATTTPESPAEITFDEVMLIEPVPELALEPEMMRTEPDVARVAFPAMRTI